MKKTIEWLNTANFSKPDLENVIEWINSELNEIRDAEKAKDIEGIKDGIADAQIFLENLLYKYDIDPKDQKRYYNAVQKSNFSKYCKTEKEAIQTVNAYRNGTHPDKVGFIILMVFTSLKGCQMESY
jgi:CBS domain containing-hemolysin-like protein